MFDLEQINPPNVLKAIVSNERWPSWCCLEWPGRKSDEGTRSVAIPESIIAVQRIWSNRFQCKPEKYRQFYFQN